MLDFEKGYYGELETVKNFVNKPDTLHRLFAVVVAVLSFIYFFR